MDIMSILEKHLKWANGELGGERADLREANLYGAFIRLVKETGI